MSHRTSEILKIIDNLYNSVANEDEWQCAKNQFETLLKSEANVEILIPHFNQALALRNKLHQNNLQINELKQILNRLDIGVWVIDSKLEVIFSDQEAAQYSLKYPHIFATNQNKLSLNENSVHNQFVNFIITIFKNHSGGKKNHYKSLKLRADEQVNLVVMATLHKTTLAKVELLGKNTYNLLVFLSDSKSTPKSSAELISVSMGLTIAEAKLAKSLLDGCSTAEYAMAKGISKATARNQLQSIFAKTGVNKQSELVKQLTKIFGFLK